MIPITKPFNPPLDEYNVILKEIWGRNWFTNFGPVSKEFESKVSDYLGAPNMAFLCNATLGLQIAMKALKLQGEIITTPFSFIATSSSILWEHFKPVFVDIQSDSLNINPELIESKITDKTSAILATHCFGNPCEINEIETIAKKHNLKTIYDAAHCFGVHYKGNSIFNYGDVSILSFHATKLFHTIEGGAVFSKDDKLIDLISCMSNFGFDGPYNFSTLGINAKNSELHAAIGVVNLKYADEILEKRKRQYSRYKDRLDGLTKIKFQKLQQDSVSNFSYLPIIFNDKSDMVRAMDNLEKNQVYPRRYFYPSLNKIDFVKGEDTIISESISERVICLPLYHDLSDKDIDFICDLILKTFSV